MKKYLVYFKLHLQKQVTYKWTVFAEFFLSFISTGVYIFIWYRLTGEYGSVKGYDFPDFVAYYVFAQSLLLFWYTPIRWVIGGGVKEGLFSALLVKPVSVRLSLFTQSVAALVSRLIMRAPMFFVVFFVVTPVRENFAPNLLEFCFFIFYMFLFYIFVFAWEFFVCQFIFVQKSSSGISGVLWNVRNLFSGSLVPFDVLPNWISKFMVATPFAFGMFLPVQFLMGRVSVSELGHGAIQLAIWSFGFLFISHFIWSKVKKDYSGVGI